MQYSPPVFFLVLIGPNWVGSDNAIGRDSDWPRKEIEIALKRVDEGENITIVPVLIRGASMPEAKDLPSSISKLAYYNAATLRDAPHFRKDIRELANQIRDLEISSFTNSNWLVELFTKKEPKSI